MLNNRRIKNFILLFSGAVLFAVTLWSISIGINATVNTEQDAIPDKSLYQLGGGYAVQVS
jgi:hypothetical protein